MPRIAYVPHRFGAGTLATIEQADLIIGEYRAQGYELTLRQLYYQFVARGLIPNNQRQYKRLGTIISAARLAGLLDWLSIVDRLRAAKGTHHWQTPSSIIDASAASYNIDTRADQDTYLEAWIEKDALAGVMARPCEAADVPHFACRGYVSQSALWGAAQRIIAEGVDKGRFAVVLHLGDHDPSGIDMTRDIQDRLNTFGADVTVERLALNMDQVEEYDPPPNPAKLTDSRCAGYVAVHGGQSWELDALEPTVIHDVVARAIARHTSRNRQAVLREKQEAERSLLQALADNWNAYAAMIAKDQKGT